jgi:hypothetical protein
LEIPKIRLNGDFSGFPSPDFNSIKGTELPTINQLVRKERKKVIKKSK